jgi:signal transduction histidine kinase/CheY-like chemotaxis protein
VQDQLAENQTRLASVQTAMLNILEDFETEKQRQGDAQRALLNILEDNYLEKRKLAEINRRIELTNADLEDFAYVASHDLKAPLRVIDNATKWLEEDLEPHLTEGPRENLTLVRSRVRRMEKLLDDLLDYSRIGRTLDARYEESVGGDELLDDVLSLLQIPGSCVVNVSPRFADIRVCRMPLQQLLMNLIGNAIKHHDKQAPQIVVTVEDLEDTLSLAVRDDGPGIPAQFHDQIFKMFQTLKPRDQVEGSGMGLAIVRKHLENFNGTLSLESAEGLGSTFRFTWPKQQQFKFRNLETTAATQVANPPSVPALEAPGRAIEARRPALPLVRAADGREPIRLLLVEDDDGDARAIERAFRQADISIQIVRATDGVEALEMLRGLNGRARIQSPCIVLMDLNMPRMGGLQTVRALREDKELSKTIVFVLTTSKNGVDKLAAYDLNVAGYIEKETAGCDFLNLASLVYLFWRVVEIP